MLVAIMVALGAGLSLRGGGEPGPPRAAAFVPAGTPPVLAIRPVSAPGVMDDPSAFGVRAADARTRQRLGAALAAATQDGRSPIAHVIRPTALRAGPGGRVLERLETETEFGSPRVHAIVGHRGDWLEVLAAEVPNGRTAWVRAEDVEVGGVGYALHVSVDGREVEVRRRGRTVRRVEVGVGRPDTPTPAGTYAVTDKLRLTEPGSPYGCCVLAFTGHQPDIPQGWSGGDRLAVHATPDEATVGAAASLGCLRARQADMEPLLEEIPLGTPVVVAD